MPGLEKRWGERINPAVIQEMVQLIKDLDALLNSEPLMSYTGPCMQIQEAREELARDLGDLLVEDALNRDGEV